MGLQIPHDNNLEDDDQPICTNVDSSLHKTDPHDVLLHSPSDFDFQSDLKKLSSQLDNNESYVAPRLQKFISEQDLRKDILRRFSSFLVSSVVFLGLFYNIWSWSCLLPLQKQHIHRFSIWTSMLGLFGFLVFVCAVALMVLVGAVFTPMQKAMLIVWLVLMHLQSANSILEICVILLAGFFMASYAFWKKESPNNESDVKSSNIC
ncbi:uncharacterized protein LOC127126672 [Lathyrus oleraceus]|uniref:Uncharacterized protein n=1 Tax=Pisum sativum TaxID=3888 RepID=A0A9D5AZF3_PEA|nr:uncharacterized protein LOC127126669 [Pisum sativum]XP_050911588.1 uncharacterized protein LOC127126672 [Pisum sativum]KAI5427816.1 hypothetical protein KIW84_033009 [Pisum sativum]KAI5427823.1 hypothetical protein KIW84_033014 [Pisum sativum]